METVLLQTKLYIPSAQQRVVTRPDLVARLDEGLSRKLALISAPAGFGKTTLVREWVTGCAHPVAWLSLDGDDSDPVRFFTYFVTALQRIDEHAGAEALHLLGSPQPPPLELLLPSLLNDIAAIEDDFVFVLDDYHLVDAQAVDRALTFLLEHLPPQMHLVVTTREDPPFPLARLRARGQLTELRAADLRFTLTEAADFLNDVMGLNLSAEAVETLGERTEGWIAGLQLAAVSMQGRDDKDSFVAAFSGTHRFVLDYLVEEVLQQQPERIRSFLLKTAILDRLTGPLCDAVTGQDDGEATLQMLERANLFVVPLDDERQWYRYHHLFAELLRQRLYQRTEAMSGDGRVVAGLHLRASEWFEEHSFRVEAFQHAAAAHDVTRAERLMAGDGVPLYFQGATGPVLNWLESLDTAVMDSRPSLWVSYATALTITGRQIDNIEEKLQLAEAALEGGEPDARTHDLIGQIATIRAMLAIPQNQPDTIISEAHRALGHLHPANLPVRTTAAWALGYAYQLRGDRAAARQAYDETLQISRASDNTIITIAALVSLGQIQEADTQLHLAADNYRHVIALAGEPPLPGANEAHFGLGRIAYQWNDLDAARQHAERSLALAQQMENIDSPGAIGVLLADIQLAHGDADGAAAALAEAERFARQRHFEHLLPKISAAQVRTLLRRGDLQAAVNLAAAHDLPITRARVLLAQGNASAALDLLEPVQHEMDERGWANELLNVMILRSLAHHADGNAEQAYQTLGEALALAAPDGMIRVFVDEGPPMARLLSELATLGIMPDTIARLLDAFDSEAHERDAGYSAHAQLLLEPLSPRELEVLELIAEGLSNREIGERLFLALDTVKGHNRRLYAKLHVQRRTEAVARARELGLI